ncbi:unnamed protein product [Boreogadus saida]
MKDGRVHKSTGIIIRAISELVQQDMMLLGMVLSSLPNTRSSLSTKEKTEIGPRPGQDSPRPISTSGPWPHVSLQGPTAHLRLPV